jgi:8-oxo-dGTP pyrophosphatase MutT (NUDIX family)
MEVKPNPEGLREITREIVSGLVISSDDKLLMGKKDPSKGGVYADCWHIPGGGVDEGEDKLTTLNREIQEETGVVIEDAEIELVDDNGRGATEKTLKGTGERVWCNMNFNVYSVRLTRKSDEISLTPTDDLVELQWFSFSELPGVQVTPPSRELFTRLGYIPEEEA